MIKCTVTGMAEREGGHSLGWGKEEDLSCMFPSHFSRASAGKGVVHFSQMDLICFSLIQVLLIVPWILPKMGSYELATDTLCGARNC